MFAQFFPHLSHPFSLLLNGILCLRCTSISLIFLLRLYETIGSSLKTFFILSDLYKVFIFFLRIVWISGRVLEYAKTRGTRLFCFLVLYCRSYCLFSMPNVFNWFSTVSFQYPRFINWFFISSRRLLSSVSSEHIFLLSRVKRICSEEIRGKFDIYVFITE